MSAPVVSEDGNYVKILWVAPNFNFDSITSYQILLVDSTGNYAE